MVEREDSIMRANFVEKKRVDKNKHLMNEEINTNHFYKEVEFDKHNKCSGLVITSDSVYEYDMDCLMKNKKCC